MKTAMTKKNMKTSASASVVDGKLILSFPDAATPVLWQMDLAQAKASALEVREKGGNQTALVIKNPRGETMDVAVFEHRAHAIEGLKAAAYALENAHGQIRQASIAANDGGIPAAQRRAAPGSKKKKWLITIVSLLALFVLFNIWASTLPQQIRVGEDGTDLTSSSVNPQDSAGVPVSADAYLNAR